MPELKPNKKAQRLIERGQEARRAGEPREKNPFANMNGRKMAVYASWWDKGWQSPEKVVEEFFNDRIPF